ncbi:cytochrome b/b6 domain-containing protein [Thiohalomonas denitrificans]|uniref:cytochrome b/b6 domain-containing protein n=1 Tax=Thiohalomonas denitrificans TaxID=415747 RepID=UPI0026EE03C1|nr:cytochrome b/b6 domain-containing protein [Thiohalomonas denitrificans]
MTRRRVMVFSRFERFWHWTQMLLIMTLLFTGLAVHGLHHTITFEAAAGLHSWSAIALIVLWLLAIFWHFTTGAWRHYLPTTQGLWAVARFYAYGIFKGERHPYRKAFWRKHNPLQALAYLALKLVLFPAVWITGVAYLTYNLWADPASNADALGWVAAIHLLAAYAILAFVVVHAYLLTIGGSFWHHLRPMLDGYDEVELTEAEAAYLSERGKLP